MIRDIEPADRDAWERLFLAYGVFYKTAFDRPVLDGVWAWLMDDAAPVRAFVAVEGAEVFGFALYREVPDTFTAGPAWFLDDLYVDPEHRGSGAGTALIEAITDYAREHGGGTFGGSPRTTTSRRKAFTTSSRLARSGSRTNGNRNAARNAMERRR